MYLKSINEQVGATTRLAPSTKPIDDATQKLITHVLEKGYVIIENAFPESAIDETISELERISLESQGGPASSGGRNQFEGFQTQRIYALLNKSRVFDKFAMHPAVLALNDYFLEPGYLLNTFQSISIQPGEDPQTLHHDDGNIGVPRPHGPFGTAIMVALDAFSPTNGATVVVPSSHRWGPEPIPSRDQAIPVIMPKGSIVYFLGTLWHGGGQNSSDKERRALTVQYCQPWVRPYENQILAVDWEKLDEIPPRIVDMMGYKVGAPFVGHVDGRTPRRAVERLLEERKGDSRLKHKL